MGDNSGIVISGGGSIEVGTDTLFTAAAALGREETELAAELRELAAIDRLVGTRSAGIAGCAQALAAEREMDAASAALGRARSAAGLLAGALHGSAAEYGEVERAARGVAQYAAAGLGYAVGLEFAQWTPALIVVGQRLGVLFDGSRPSGSVIPAALKAPAKALVNSPELAVALRLAVMSADEFGTGMLRLPLTLDPADTRLGDQGLSTSIGALRDLGGDAGMLKETPVRTTVTSSDLAPAGVPTGWEDRALRIPGKGTTDQVRIDTYEMPDGTKRYEVYIGGTRDFALGPDDQPWDMTSNLVGIEGGHSASMRAVEAAMKDSGITSDSPVLITGHSQGGLVAASITGSGDYNVQGLFTLGGPAAQSTVPDSIPWIALEHSNDIVPALSGTWAHSDPVIVTREVSAEEIDASPHWFPAHLLPAYEKTAALADASGDPRVDAAAQSFDDFTAGATPILSETYTSVRETGD